MFVKIRRKLKKIIQIAALPLMGLIYWGFGSKLDNIILTKYTKIPDQFLLKPSNTICERNLYLLILVTSYVGHGGLRNAHRTAMPATFLKSRRAMRVFLLAGIPEKETTITQAAIDDENKTFGDILQVSFEEHYRSLTYKNLVGLRWASTECYNATFILKVDDDTVFNLDKTYQLLSKLNNSGTANNLLLGFILNDTIPQRNKDDKWYVSWREYEKRKYPKYLSGGYYVTTPKVARKLAEEAAHHPYFWVDDVFITGIVAGALNITLTAVPKGYLAGLYEILECCMTKMIKNSIKCGYGVGYNVGNDTIVEYNRALKKCNRSKKCSRQNEVIEVKCRIRKDSEGKDVTLCNC